MAHSIRPTLPPLHTLRLPRGDIPPSCPHESDENSSRVSKLHVPPMLPHCHQGRQLPAPAVSLSSQQSLPPGTHLRLRTNTSIAVSTPTSTLSLPLPLRRIRLAPTSFENADAVLLVTPSSTPDTTPPEALLLVGPALERLRRRERKIAKDSRLHPYRIVRGPCPPTRPSQTQA